MASNQIANNNVVWIIARFNDLSLRQLHDLLAARQAVFVVEQDCVYLDADGADFHSTHVMAYRQDALMAYCRLVDPGVKYAEASIGRVLTTNSARGLGLGKLLMVKAIEHIERAPVQTAIRISAQHYLEAFYQQFGFQTVSEPYDEDGIPHIEMLRPLNDIK